MTARPSLSVLVISHGHEAMLPGCLRSLQAALMGVDHEQVVIDNLPQGGLADRLRQEGLAVRVHENVHPLGFAANVNLGAGMTAGEALLLLNPDTEHRAGRIADAMAFQRSRPDVGLLGCALANEDGSRQQNYRAFPNLAFLLARGMGADRWPRRPAFYTRRLMAGVWSDAPFRVDWLFGAFLLLRRADFLRAGGMDEGFRLYYEDVDLAFRLRKIGLAAYVYPGLVFVHRHMRSSAARPFGQAWRWHVRSAVRYFAKHGVSGRA